MNLNKCESGEGSPTGESCLGLHTGTENSVTLSPTACCSEPVLVCPSVGLREGVEYHVVDEKSIAQTEAEANFWVEGGREGSYVPRKECMSLGL